MSDLKVCHYLGGFADIMIAFAISSRMTSKPQAL
jgi:hypothetical protein